MTTRHIFTGEYPPQAGGVSDYSYLVAAGLASAGDNIHIWCPQSKGEYPLSTGVTVHRELGSIGPGNLRRVGQMLDQFSAPRRLLVQWVPHSYGYRSMNLYFCWWLWRRAVSRNDLIEIMVHEPYLPFSKTSIKQNLAAVTHRLMTTLLMRSTKNVWVSIPSWQKRLRPYALGKEIIFKWLPIPSNIPVIDDPQAIVKVRSVYAPENQFLIGHFGAYDNNIVELLRSILPLLLLKRQDTSVLLLGNGSLATRKRIVEEYPKLTSYIHATGALNATDISSHIKACHVMLQPYQDGISSRRTSAMSALSHGLPVVSNIGPATEDIWRKSSAVVLTNSGDIAATVEAVRSILSDAPMRARMSNAARTLYLEFFDIQHTIAAIQRAE